MIKVSTILPMYNSEKTIATALRSVVHQNIPNGVDYKVYVYDDFSSDNSISIIDPILRTYNNRVILIRGFKNKGIVFALNELISARDSDYYMRMDSDDISMPDRLTLTLKTAIAGHDIVGTAIESFGTSNFTKIYPSDKISVEMITAIDQRIFCHPSIIFSKRVASLGYRETAAEDYDLLSRTIISQMSVTNIPEVCLMYRTSNNSLSSIHSPKFISLRKSVENIRAKYIETMFSIKSTTAYNISKSIENYIFKKADDSDRLNINIINEAFLSKYGKTVKL